MVNRQMVTSQRHDTFFGFPWSRPTPSTPPYPAQVTRSWRNLTPLIPSLQCGYSGRRFRTHLARHSAPDYILQETTDLAQPQVWTTVTQTPVLSGGQYSVSLPATNATTLFRLS